jgi:chromate reductase, NAD(P)H dehydrogenase (quinone)
MEQKIRIIGICGSLRKGSYNRMALNTAKQYAPENVTFEIVEIGDLPHFNQDLEANPPESVNIFREKIKTADAILIATPEYNYSITSVLKNAIEWASRPYGVASMNQKPVAIMGASNGMMGTGRAQYHLRQILVQTDSYVVNRPEVMIPFAQDKFDPEGKLNDSKTGEKIKELVEALVVWTIRLRQ